MGSVAELKLPLIDFSSPELRPGTQEWTSVKGKVREALEEYRCFEAVFDKVPMELRKSTLGLLPDLFDLPLETKLRNVSEKPYHGYQGQYPQVPLYESMGIDEANMYDKVDQISRTLWPQGHPKFSENIQAFSEKLSELDQIVRRMIVESLGVGKYLEEHMNSTNYLLRVMKYEGPQTTDSKLGLPAHTDKNALTILYQNEVEGCLEVQTKDGEWISVKPSPSSFIVMTGYSLYAWTNGRVHSSPHRVMMSGNDARYSIGLFSMPKAGYMIKAPAELVNEQYPLLFKPFDFIEFLKFQQRTKSTLEAYCGV